MNTERGLNSPVSGSRGRVVYGVTIGGSALGLLNGQLSWLRRNGWDVILIATPDEKAHRASSREGVVLVGINMSRDISPLGDLVALFKWIYSIWRLRPDVVNVSTPKAALLGGVAAYILRVPRRVYVMRGLRLEGASGPLKVLLWLMEWVTTRIATDVIVVSASLASQASRFKVLPRNMPWIVAEGSSNGVNATAVASRASDARNDDMRGRLGFSARDFVVGFVGRVHRDKGIDTLIRAFASGRMHERARLLIVGPIEHAELEDNLRILGSRVVLTGHTDDVWGHLAAMDVLCLPTLREGFPNVVLEAAAAGLPTIVTRATGAVDAVIDDRTGYHIDVGDDVALVDCVNRLVLSPGEAARLGASARERVLDKFQPERVWSGVEQVLSGDVRHGSVRRVDE